MKQARKTVFREEITYKDWHYRMYLNGERTDQGIIPMEVWKKYLLAEESLGTLRLKVRIKIESKQAPDIKLWLAYNDAIKEFWLVRTELEIYYYEQKYGAETSYAANSIRKEER
jgi:hypothetical protein